MKVSLEEMERLLRLVEQMSLGYRSFDESVAEIEAACTLRLKLQGIEGNAHGYWRDSSSLDDRLKLAADVAKETARNEAKTVLASYELYKHLSPVHRPITDEQKAQAEATLKALSEA